jgi:hypothetical protein
MKPQNLDVDACSSKRKEDEKKREMERPPCDTYITGMKSSLWRAV